MVCTCRESGLGSCNEPDSSSCNSGNNTAEYGIDKVDIPLCFTSSVYSNKCNFVQVPIEECERNLSSACNNSDHMSFLPIYAHYNDAGADLCTVEKVVLQPFEHALVSTGVSIALPDGFVALVHPRSGLAVKKGVTVLNAPGTIDSGYRGEIKVPLINLNANETVTFEVGDRIAQLVVQRYVQACFNVVTSLPETSRGTGGFGSTGVSSKGCA